MATSEQNGLLTYINSAGNKYLLYPITKGANVVGAVEDSDMLGGLAANEYLLKTGTASDSEKLGGVAAESYPTKELLWENASPTSDFAAQTLYFTASSYTHFAVISRSGSSNNFTIVCPGQSAYMMGFEGATGRKIIGRDVYVNDDGSGIIFADAKSRSTYGGDGTASNNELIPFRIYGLNL